MNPRAECGCAELPVWMNEHEMVRCLSWVSADSNVLAFGRLDVMSHSLQCMRQMTLILLSPKHAVRYDHYSGATVVGQELKG